MRRVLTGRASGAFTLTEFLLALSVLVLASVLLFSVLGRMRRGAQREKLGADLRGLAAAFEKYHVENGRREGQGKIRGVGSQFDHGRTAARTGRHPAIMTAEGWRFR